MLHFAIFIHLSFHRPATVAKPLWLQMVIIRIHEDSGLTRISFWRDKRKIGRCGFSNRASNLYPWLRPNPSNFRFEMSRKGERKGKESALNWERRHWATVTKSWARRTGREIESYGVKKSAEKCKNFHLSFNRHMNNGKIMLFFIKLALNLYFCILF